MSGVSAREDLWWVPPYYRKAQYDEHFNFRTRWLKMKVPLYGYSAERGLRTRYHRVRFIQRLRKSYPRDSIRTVIWTCGNSCHYNIVVSEIHEIPRDLTPCPRCFPDPHEVR